MFPTLFFKPKESNVVWLDVYNSGGPSTSDWTDQNGDGLANGWIAAPSDIKEIVTWDALSGSVQKLTRVISGLLTNVDSWPGLNNVPEGDPPMKLKFRYKSSSPISVLRSDVGAEIDVEIGTVAANTGDPVEVVMDITPGVLDYTIAFYIQNDNEWMELDYIQVTQDIIPV